MQFESKGPGSWSNTESVNSTLKKSHLTLIVSILDVEVTSHFAVQATESLISSWGTQLGQTEEAGQGG